MQKPIEVLDIFDSYREIVDRDIHAILDPLNGDMYRMLSYFLGYVDESFTPVNVYAGKRFRSGLCLLLADMYGDCDSARPAATSIELYHNFTLIHDDIVDKDTLRRGRPTVWKLWGADHAINSGDAQLILANMSLLQTIKEDAELGVELYAFLNEQYLRVHEGQYLDFEMSSRAIDDPFNTYEQYFDMIAKKTSVLVGAATKAAGIVTGRPKEEVALLWEFGYHLGLAYQLSDDLVSIWGDASMTGKVSCNDLREKKKTLPVMYAYENVREEDRRVFAEMYGERDALSDMQVEMVSALLEKAKAYEYTRDVVLEHAGKAHAAVEALSLGEEPKQLLHTIIDTLLPDVKT